MPCDWSDYYAFGMVKSPHQEILFQFDVWKESFLGHQMRSQMAKTIWWSRSPWGYFLAFDPTTQVAIVVSILVCCYIFFSSVMRVGKMLFSLAILLLQLALIAVVILMFLEYRDLISSTLQVLAEKLDL